MTLALNLPAALLVGAALGFLLARVHRPPRRDKRTRLSGAESPPAGPRLPVWPYLLGMILGGVCLLAASRPGWPLTLALTGWLAAALLLEEFLADPEGQALLPEMILFLEAVGAAVRQGVEVCAACSLAAHHLPPGPLRERARRTGETAHRGAPALRTLCGVIPWLDQLAGDAEHVTGPALERALALLCRRAELAWHKGGVRRGWIAAARLWVRGGRGAVLGGLGVGAALLAVPGLSVGGVLAGLAGGRLAAAASPLRRLALAGLTAALAWPLVVGMLMGVPAQAATISATSSAPATPTAQPLERPGSTGTLPITAAWPAPDLSLEPACLIATGIPNGHANVRAGPGTRHAVLGTLAEGERQPILALEAGWVQVKVDAARTGWVYAALCAPFTLPVP